jgi:hypothetical protein
MDGKWILWIFLLLGSVVYGQSFQYSYTDPCTGILQTVIITQPSGSVTLFYAGQYQTFTAAQLQAGGYEAWVQGINSTFPTGSNPCAGGGSSIATGSNAAIGTNTVNNVSGIISIAAGIGGSLGSSALPGGGAVAGGGTSNTGNNDNSSNNSNNGSSSNGGSSSSTSSGSGSGSGSSGSGSSGSSGSGGGSGSSGGSSGSGGSGSSGGGGSGSSGGGSTGSGGGSTSNPGSGQEGTGGSLPAGSSGGTSEGGAVGGSDNTTTASGGESESSSSEGGGSGGGGQKQKNKQEKVGRGALIGSGDFVAIRNSSDIQKSGNDNFRFNMSLTHVNTKQNFIKGVNLNFTTGENVLNTTFYGSYKAKGFMGVFSNSTMTNFKSDIFNTTTALAAQKTGPATWMLGSNLTLGKIGKSQFQNWSIVGGGFTTFKGGKSFSANLMALGIYSPYIFYYEGQWYRSGILLVPLANIDFKLTDKFKWSISFSGAYQWKADILNYQLSTGTKMLL